MARTLTNQTQDTEVLRPAGPSGGKVWPPPIESAASDSWPHTGRLMPWLVAVFLGMIFLVPFDSTQLRISLPVDAKLDRVLIMIMLVAWAATYFAGGSAAPRWRRSPLVYAVAAFAAVAIGSILLNVSVLHKQGELTGAIKSVSIAGSWVILFFVVATTIRPKELPRLVTLLLGFATITAIGTLVEYWTGRNYFIEWWGAIVPEALFDFSPVQSKTTVFQTDPITAHTRHALALTGLMAMALSFAVVRLSRVQDLRSKLIYAGLTALITLAVFSTGRKTGSFAAIAVLIVLFAMQPRKLMRLAPAGICILAILTLMRPQAVEPQLEKLLPGQISQGASAEGRIEDYRAITPDVREHLVLGRGYGSYDPAKYRILDNQMLVLLVSTGALGLGVYALMLFGVPLAARRHVRSPDPARSEAALAAAGVAGALATSSFLFDALAFTHPVYVFFFGAGLVAVCAEPRVLRREPEVAPAAAEDAVAEPLPPLEAEAVTQALPPLTADVELERARAALEREREHREHAGRRRRGGRRFGGRGAPIRDRVSGPLPGRSADVPEPPEPARRGPDIDAARERVRAAGRRVRSGGAGRMLLGIVTLGIAIAAFGRGGGTGDEGGTPQLGQAGAGGPIEDPFGSGGGDADELAGEDTPEAPAAKTPRRRSAVGDVVPVSAPPTVPTQPRRRSTDEGEKPRTETPRKRRRKPRKPRKPGPAPAPTPPTPEPAGGPSKPDCLPGNAEETLRQLDIEPCTPNGEPSSVAANELHRAYVAGKLSAREVNELLTLLEVARNS